MRKFGQYLHGGSYKEGSSSFNHLEREHNIFFVFSINSMITFSKVKKAVWGQVKNYFLGQPCKALVLKKKWNNEIRLPNFVLKRERKYQIAFGNHSTCINKNIQYPRK